MLYLAAYEGKSFISKMIRKITRDNESHVSIVTDEMIEYEAWHKSSRTKWYRPFTGCFQKVPFGKNHTPGTHFTLYSIPLTENQEQKAIKILEDWANKRIPYDYVGPTRFVSLVDRGNKEKMFCSESVMRLCRKIGFNLLVRVEDWLVTPAMTTYSPLVNFYCEFKIGDPIILKKCYKSCKI